MGAYVIKTAANANTVLEHTSVISDAKIPCTAFERKRRVHGNTNPNRNTGIRAQISPIRKTRSI